MLVWHCEWETSRKNQATLFVALPSLWIFHIKYLFYFLLKASFTCFSLTLQAYINSAVEHNYTQLLHCIIIVWILYTSIYRSCKCNVAPKRIQENKNGFHFTYQEKRDVCDTLRVNGDLNERILWHEKDKDLG